jgi:HK97 family phage prohead protease
MRSVAQKFVDQQRFRELAARGDAAGVGVHRPASVLRVSGGDSRIVRFILSDGSVDRMGDTIDPNGWDLAGYKQNPVVLFAHDALAPPIGRMVNIFSDGLRLIGDVEFATAATYAFADTIFRLVRDGFLNAGSVGFRPINFFFAKDRDRPSGVDFHQTELLEFSIVPVPANENALAQACAKGLLGYNDAQRLGAGQFYRDAADSNTDRAARVRRLAELQLAPGRAAIGAPLLVNTLGYAGTAAQRYAQWRWDHRGQIRSAAAAERDLARAAADSSTAAGRSAIVDAFWRYQERTA